MAYAAILWRVLRSSAMPTPHCTDDYEHVYRVNTRDWRKSGNRLRKFGFSSAALGLIVLKPGIDLLVVQFPTGSLMTADDPRTCHSMIPGDGATFHDTKR